MGTAGVRRRRSNSKADSIRKNIQDNVSKGNLRNAVSTGLSVSFLSYSSNELAGAIISAKEARTSSKSILKETKGKISGSSVSKAVGQTLRNIGESTRKSSVTVSPRVRQSIRPTITSYLIKKGRR